MLFNHKVQKVWSAGTTGMPVSILVTVTGDPMADTQRLQRKIVLNPFPVTTYLYLQ